MTEEHSRFDLEAFGKQAREDLLWVLKTLERACGDRFGLLGDDEIGVWIRGGPKDGEPQVKQSVLELAESVVDQWRLSQLLDAGLTLEELTRILRWSAEIRDAAETARDAGYDAAYD